MVCLAISGMSIAKFKLRSLVAYVPTIRFGRCIYFAEKLITKKCKGCNGNI